MPTLSPKPLGHQLLQPCTLLAPIHVACPVDEQDYTEYFLNSTLTDFTQRLWVFGCTSKDNKFQNQRPPSSSDVKCNYIFLVFNDETLKVFNDIINYKRHFFHEIADIY